MLHINVIKWTNIIHNDVGKSCKPSFERKSQGKIYYLQDVSFYMVFKYRQKKSTVIEASKLPLTLWGVKLGVHFALIWEVVIPAHSFCSNPSSRMLMTNATFWQNVIFNAKVYFLLRQLSYCRSKIIFWNSNANHRTSFFLFSFFSNSRQLPKSIGASGRLREESCQGKLRKEKSMNTFQKHSPCHILHNAQNQKDRHRYKLKLWYHSWI